MTRVIDSAAAWQAARTEAIGLLDAGDAAGAVALAEECTAAQGQEFNVTQLQAAMYTDGGQILHRRDLVERGAGLWRTLDPDAKPDIAYNLANAELGMYQLGVAEPKPFPSAWQENQGHLSSARTLFEHAASDKAATKILRLQALTNAGNAYDKVGRYIDALTCYDQALAIDHEFAMALGNRGVALEHAAWLMRDHGPAVLKEAAANLDAAIARRGSVVKYGGTRAVAWFEKVRARIRVKDTASTESEPRKEWADPHLQWCRRHELFLHVSHACLQEDTKRLDPLFFRRIITATDDAERERVHHLVDAFDAIKQEYVAARYALWLASERSSPIRDHSTTISERVTFLDSLDYARWGIRTAMAVQALASASNVLDKVASFVHLYLVTGRRVRGVYFDWLWQERDNKPMDPEIMAELERPKVNVGLLALCDLSCDLRRDTPLSKRVGLRHTATHRFVVAHTESAPSSDEWFDRMRWPELVRESVAQLQVARAALIYLARMIDGREHARSEKGRAEGRVIPGIPIPAVDSRLVEYE